MSGVKDPAEGHLVFLRRCKQALLGGQVGHVRKCVLVISEDVGIWGEAASLPRCPINTSGISLVLCHPELYPSVERETSLNTL